MVRSVCEVKVKDKDPSKKLSERLGTDDIILLPQQNIYVLENLFAQPLNLYL